MDDFGVPSVMVANLVAEGMAVKALFWNSPGVYDGTSNEHIKKMKDLLSSIDLVVYTLRMDETRMRPEDIEIMQKLTRAFGSSLWRMGILVLTFANRVSYLDDHQTMRQSKEHIMKRARQWEERVHEVLIDEGVPRSNARCPGRASCRACARYWRGTLEDSIDEVCQSQSE